MWIKKVGKKSHIQTFPLFIKGLDKNVTEKQLHDLFYTFGEVESCKIIQTNWNTNTAFINYYEEESALFACESFPRTFFNSYIQVRYRTK